VSTLWISEFESGKPTAELGLVMRLLDVLGLRLALDERGGDDRPQPLEPVDLDALLDDYSAR
jgi:hypothetical protein